MTQSPEGSARGRVLVVDDDASLAEMLTIVLRQEGFDTRMCGRGDEAMEVFRGYRPDLVLLDLMLPGRDGIDVCKEIRAESGVPIVMLTAKGDTIDVVLGLESGADDYVVKPFSPAELVARVDAVLRRVDTSPELEEPISFDGLAIDPAARRVAVRGEEVQLTAREYELLVHFARHPGQVFSRDQLMDAVWQYSFYTDTSTVTVHIRRLRSKIEDDPSEPRWLETVWGVGYRFQP